MSSYEDEITWLDAASFGSKYLLHRPPPHNEQELEQVGGGHNAAFDNEDPVQGASSRLAVEEKTQHAATENDIWKGCSDKELLDIDTYGTPVLEACKKSALSKFTIIENPDISKVSVFKAQGQIRGRQTDSSISDNR